jgi:hypothetical protein
MPSLNFLLTGEDGLSPVLTHAGDNADDLARRLDAASRSGSASTARFTRDADGRLRDLRGRYISVADAQRLLSDGMPDLTGRVGDLSSASDRGAEAMEALGKVTAMLWPAAIPAAASLAPLAAGAGTVAVALGVMGAAMGPQIGKLGELAEAEQKWQDAVDESGATSEAAVTAHQDYLRQLAQVPQATREAAAAVGLLKDNYQDWSDSLAGDTMAPLTKGVGLLNALLPKTTGLVKVTSSETDRLMTILGGSLATPGLDAANAKFTAFAQRTLSGLNDQLVHLLRISDGQVGGNAREFMNWARAQGPAVASVVRSIATALMHVLEAGSDVGVGLLQAVEVLAQIVGAVPPEAIAVLLQLALALKVTKAAVLGMAAGRAALAAFGAQILAVRTAAAAAPGPLAATTAGIAALSRTTKIALAGTGIGLLLIALSELSDMGETAPPDVDKLTTSLGNLGRTGQATGYAAQQFGADFSKLHEQIARVTDPSVLESINNWGSDITGGFLDAGDATEEFTKNAGAIDDALTNLVRGGNASLAKAALADMMKGLNAEDAKRFREELDGFDQALADLAFEERLAAESQGIFGAQAQQVQAKLAAQKASADGLRQSILALSETSRSAFDAETKFEAALDAVDKAIKDNGATLDVHSEKGRANREALSQMAGATAEAAAKARENGASWSTVSGIWDKGRKSLVDNITAITGNRREAERLANQLLRMPSPKLRLEMRTEDAIKGLGSVVAAMRKAPNAKSVTVNALTADAISLLRDLGLKVSRMKDGRFKVTAETGTAKSNIAAVQRARDALKDKSITLSARDRASATARAIQSAIDNIRGKSVTVTTVYQTIGAEGTAARNAKNAAGYAGGGRPRPGEVAWVGENGPELMLFDGTEKILDHNTSMSLITPSSQAGQLAGQGLIAGMSASTSTVEAAARKMAAAVTDGIRAELQIASPSKKTKALAHDVGKGFVLGLTGSRDRIRATAKDLADDIRLAFSGKKESALLAFVTREAQQLLAVAAKRDKVAAKIAAAKDYANTLIRNAREGASLSSLGMEPDQVTAGGIKGGLASKLAQIKQFTRYIDILAKRGLNKSLLRQILNMGPEQGYAYASALVGADKATFKQINSLQSQIDKSAKGLGRLGADALYDSGKNASKGFLTGLQSQQKTIEDFMVKIAKGMQAAIKKALGIKSPSTVMARLGAFSTQGLARGLVAGLPAVDQALGVVSGRIAGIQPVMGRAAVVRPGGMTVINVTVEVPPTADRGAIAREVQQLLLEHRRNLGGVALGFG